MIASNSQHIEEEIDMQDRKKRQLGPGTMNYLKNVQTKLKQKGKSGVFSLTEISTTGVDQMMMGRQPYAERGRGEMGGGSGEESPVSLASTIDHNNLWKYKPDKLQ